MAEEIEIKDHQPDNQSPLYLIGYHVAKYPTYLKTLKEVELLGEAFKGWDHFVQRSC